MIVASFRGSQSISWWLHRFMVVKAFYGGYIVCDSKNVSWWLHRIVVVKRFMTATSFHGSLNYSSWWLHRFVVVKTFHGGYNVSW